MNNHKTPKRNAEGYYDPTAYYGIRPVVRAERKKLEDDGTKKTEPPKIYICSPYRGDVETNVSNARRYCRFAVERGKFPIAPHLLLPQFMDDDNPAERELAISFAIRLLYDCKGIWVFAENLCGSTNITDGMKREIAAAKWRGIRIRQFTEDLKEVEP